MLLAKTAESQTLETAVTMRSTSCWIASTCQRTRPCHALLEMESETRGRAMRGKAKTECTAS